MKPGPKPKPTLTLVGGRTAGKRRPARPAKPRPSAPTAPAWLSPQERTEWRRVVPELDRLGVVSAPYRAVLYLWCQTWAPLPRGGGGAAREAPPP